MDKKREKLREQEQELAAIEASLCSKLDAIKNEDPFWFYEPYDGTLSDEKREFLGRYLNPEDIPDKTDGQLDVHLSTCDIIGVTGGNQSGKTTLGAIENFIFITGSLPRSLEGIYPKEKLPTRWPVDIRVVGVSDKQVANTVLKWYRHWCPRRFLLGGSWEKSFSSQHNILGLFADRKQIGSIEFMNNRQDVDVFQGPPKQKMSYDEEPRRSIREENLMRMVTADRIREDYYYTPTNGLTWTADLFGGLDEDVVDGRSIGRFRLCSVANPKANLRSLEVICNEITGGKPPGQVDMQAYNALLMRLLGHFTSRSSLVYGGIFDKRVHVIAPFFEGLTEEEKRDYLMVTGLDPHTTTKTAMVFVLIDREGNCYVDDCYFGDCDTETLKEDYWGIVTSKGYRPGWCVADKSSNTNIPAFGGRNIFLELLTGPKGLPGLIASQKFIGSIMAGVDEMKKRFRRGGLFIVNRPSTAALVSSFRTLQRSMHVDEDVRGEKDRIQEGRHHHHAALRYLFQYPVNWYPVESQVRLPEDTGVMFL